MWNEYDSKFPSRSTSIMADSVSFSVPACSEHEPLDSVSGSMGTTRSAKYTDVPRLMASWSITPPMGT